MGSNAELRASFETLSKTAFLEVLLPRSFDVDVAALLKDGRPQELGLAPSRRHLFFDEKARIVLVLKVSASEEDVQYLLPSLEIVLAAHATDAAPQGGGNAASAAGKHEVTSVCLPAGAKADIMAAGSETYVVWQPTIHLTRPRTRLQRPAIYFTANIVLGDQALAASRKPDLELLTPFEPLSANVLEPLNFDPALRGHHVYLSEDRITKVAPHATPKDDAMKPIRGASKRAFPTMPALFTRISYDPVPDGVIASLHIETSQAIAGTFYVNNVALDLSQTGAETNSMRGGDSVPSPTGSALERMSDVAWPMQMHAGDETVLLYMIKPRSKNTANSSATLTVFLSLQASATLDQGSQIELCINWQSQPSPPAIISESAYMWSRPLRTSSAHKARLSTPNGSMPGASGNTQKAALSESGVTFYFTAAPTALVNSDVQLKIKCINKSARPRRFIVTSVRSTKEWDGGSMQASIELDDMVADTQKVPVVGRPKPADVSCDSPEVQVGPLPPSDCYETGITFRVLRPGVLDLGILRIQDLDMKEAIEVKELPDIVGLGIPQGSSPDEPHGSMLQRKDEITERMDAATSQWRRETSEWIAQRSALIV